MVAVGGYIDDPDREGFAIECSGWVHRQRIED